MSNTASSSATERALTQGQIVARLERLPLSWWHIRARVIVGIATFFDAFDILAITFALPVLAELWKIAPQQIGLILSSGFAGQLVGALIAGSLAERFGRLRIAGVTIAIFAMMSLVCAFAWNPHSMMVFRFLQGIGLGGEVPVAAAYISEVAHAGNRGRFFALYELIFPLGLLSTAILGYWMVPRLGWQSMFYVGAAPALLVIFLRRLLPESPRWLASKGRLWEADAAVSRIEGVIIRSGTALPPPTVEPLAGSLRSPQSPPTHWSELFRGIYLRRTLVAWCLWFCTYIVSYGLITWLPTLYGTVFHVSLTKALGYGLITQCIGFVGSISCALLIDRVGRRAWFIGAFFGAALSLFALSLFGVASATSVFACASAGYFFVASLSLLVYLYTSEIYPTRIRAFGCGVASAWLRLASAIGPGIVAFMIVSHGLRSLFAVFGAFALFGGLATVLAGIETRSRLLEELSP
ncbi:MAG TPA: MFS transporter [Bryobacteraceae bacterium]